MSVAVKNEPYRHGAPGGRLRDRDARTAPRRPAGRAPPATLTAAVAPPSRNGVTIDRLVRLRPRDHRVDHPEVPDQRARSEFTTPISAAAVAERRRRARSAPSRCRRAPSDRSCRRSCTAGPTTGSSSTPCRCGACCTSIFVASQAPVCAQLSGVGRLGELDERVVTLERAAAPALVEIAQERWSADAHPQRRAAADLDACSRVARVQRERRAGPWRAAPSRSRDPSRRGRPRPSGPASRGACGRRRAGRRVPISSRIRIA